MQDTNITRLLRDVNDLYYEGCGSNENRFEDLLSCESTCLPSG